MNVEEYGGTLPQTFYDKLPNRTPEDLFDILAHPENYLPGAVEAANQELLRRGISQVVDSPIDPRIPSPLPINRVPISTTDFDFKSDTIISVLYLLACWVIAFRYGRIGSQIGIIGAGLLWLAGASVVWVLAVINLCFGGLAWLRNSRAVAFMVAAVICGVGPLLALVSCPMIARYAELHSVYSVDLAALREEATSLVAAHRAKPTSYAPLAPKDFPPTFKKFLPNDAFVEVTNTRVFIQKDDLYGVYMGYVVMPTGSNLPPQAPVVRQVAEGVFYVEGGEN